MEYKQSTHPPQQPKETRANKHRGDEQYESTRAWPSNLPGSPVGGRTPRGALGAVTVQMAITNVSGGDPEGTPKGDPDPLLSGIPG